MKKDQKMIIVIRKWGKGFQVIDFIGFTVRPGLNM